MHTPLILEGYPHSMFSCLMSHQSLLRRCISVTMRLRIINDSAHFLHFLRRQLNIARRPVLLQAVQLRRTRDSNHPLGRDPGKSNLSGRAAFARGKLLDLLDNGFVFIEVITLEFWNYGDQLVSQVLRFETKIHSPVRRKSLGGKSSGDLMSKLSVSQPFPRGL